MIQAMVCALVFTSGAGMSRSGPMSGLISVVKRRVRPSTSRMLSFLGSTMTPPLAPPYGMFTHGALPAHPHRQRAHLVEGHVLVVADAALARPAADVVLDAVAGEDLHVAVVHRDREIDGELALRDAQHAAHPVVEVELVRGVVELGLGDGPDVRGLRHRVLAGHQVS